MAPRQIGRRAVLGDHLERTEQPDPHLSPPTATDLPEPVTITVGRRYRPDRFPAQRHQRPATGMSIKTAGFGNECDAGAGKVAVDFGSAVVGEERNDRSVESARA